MANRVVEAYVRGTQIKQQREAEASDKQARSDAAKEAKRQFDEIQKAIKAQHDLENARADSVFNFQKSVQEMQQQQQLQENFTKFGVVPGGYEEQGGKSVDVSPGVAGASHTFKNTEGKTFSGVDPETAAMIQSRANEIVNAPAYEQAARLKKMEEDAKWNESILAYNKDLAKIDRQHDKDIELEKLKSEKAITLEGKRGANAENAAKIRATAAENAAKIRATAAENAAKIRATAAENAAKIRATAAENVPISPQIQRDIFGMSSYDPTLTTDKAAQLQLITPLTPAQKDKNAAFNDLILDVTKAKALLEEKDKDGKEYYNTYFKGLSIEGGKKSLTTKISSDERTEKVKRLLSAIELKAKNTVAALGGALTPNEQQLLEKLAPSPSFINTPEKAKAAVDGFLEGLIQFQNELIKSQGTGVKNNRPPIGSFGQK
jgi:hypothetical protein